MYKKGFTIVELLLVIGISSLIMVSIGNFQKDVITYNRYSQDSLSSAQDARNILKVIIKELRSASPANDGSFPIIQAATNTLSFYSDTDGDLLKEKIRYYIDTTTLMKGSIKPTGSPLTYNPANEIFTTLAYNLINATSTPLFEYYDSTYSGTTTPLIQPVTLTNIHLVKVNLMINPNPNNSSITRMYTSQVSIRNLKDNL